MKLLVVVVVVVAYGCSFPQVYGQAEATQIVWRQQYVMSESPPAVDWIEPPDLNCWGGNGFFKDVSPGVHASSGECVIGVYWGGWMQVAHPDGFKFSKSSFAHEHWHARMFLVTGDGDPDHEDPGFKPGGAVDLASAALEAAGL